MKNAIIAIAGFVTMGVFIAFSQKRRREEGLLPQENLPKEIERAPTDDNVQRLIAAGKKIEAIKMYRKIHRGGLKEAKDAVEKSAADNSPTA